jgi:polyisoprenoid-binding protein YceI
MLSRHSYEERQLLSPNKLALFVSAMLAGCAPQIPYERETSAPPLEESRQAATAVAETVVYRIRPEESLLLIHVGSDGKAANLGHEHAVASIDLQGFVELAADPAASRAEVVMPLMNLLVDEPQYRDLLELEKPISSDDVAATYSNMRKVLEAEQFPWVKVEATFASAESDSPDLDVSITMHGVSLAYRVPVQFTSNDNRVVVSGRLTLKQSDFGLTPFSAVGGLLKVADELQVRFVVVADRAGIPEGRSLSTPNVL